MSWAEHWLNSGVSSVSSSYCLTSLLRQKAPWAGAGMSPLSLCGFCQNSILTGGETETLLCAVFILLTIPAQWLPVSLFAFWWKWKRVVPICPFTSLPALETKKMHICPLLVFHSIEFGHFIKYFGKKTHEPRKQYWSLKAFLLCLRKIIVFNNSFVKCGVLTLSFLYF